MRPVPANRKGNATQIEELLPHGDPLCRLLEDPNNEDGTSDLLYQITQQHSLTGISLVWMPRNNPLDIPSELYVIPTATAFPLPQDIGYPQGAYRILPLYHFKNVFGEPDRDAGQR